MIEHQCSFSPKLDDTSRTFVEQLKEDQASAWGVVDRVYTGFIKANLRRFGVSDSDIEDVTQDVLLTAAGCIKRFEFRAQTGSFRSWLKTITRSRAVDHLRKKPPPSAWAAF